MKQKKCKFSEAINLYFNDEFDNDNISALLKHIKKCEECKREYDFINAIKNELTQMAEVEMPKEYQHKLHDRLAGYVNEKKAKFRMLIQISSLAAALVLVVAGVNYSGILNNKATDMANANKVVPNVTIANNDVAPTKMEDKAVIPEPKIDMKSNGANLNAEQPKQSEKILAPTAKMSEQKGKEMPVTENNNQPAPDEQEVILQGTTNSKLAQEPQQQEKVDDIPKVGAAVAPQEQGLTMAKGMNAPASDLVTNAGAAVSTAALKTIVDEGEPVSFEVIKKSNIGSIHERQNFIIRHLWEWKDIWNRIAKGKSRPRVNFNTDMLIIVCQGRQLTGGYNIEISSITENKSNIIVNINETIPAEGTMSTQVLTSPFEIVKIKKSSKTVIFR
jgi:hypothetical protein